MAEDVGTRLIIIEMDPADEREFAEILHAFGHDNLRGCTIHLAIREVADAVLKAVSSSG